MNAKIDTEIKKAAVWAQENNIRLIKGGARFWFNAEGNAVAADIIGAMLLMHNEVPPGIGLDNARLVNPGFSAKAAEILEVDRVWMYRFYMGYDRGYQIMIINEKDKESKDDVAAYGITLSKELFKKR